jgi:carboxyl-terminal processing protease
MTSRFKFAVVSFSTVLVALLLLGAVMGRSASPEDAYRHLSVYSEVLSRIKSEYVEEPDIKSVTLGAINGLLESIDPYASYLNAEQFKQYQKAQETKKASVGMVLSKKFGYVGVVDVLPGSAAAKAGLNTGDLIESISGIATRDMPLAFAEILLQGEPGSSVEISALKLRKPEPQKITLTRAAVKYPSVTSKLMPEQVGYVQVGSLETGKVKEVATALESLQKQGAKKILLDLRNAATGKPEDGIALANLFVDKGTIGYLQGQKVARQNFDADSAKVVSKLPLVVITNRGTASAAEIAAAGLLDTKRAELVGERTYGDASLRRAITMDDGGAVILSVAKYYSPSGKAIQDTGVTPGVLVNDLDAAEADDDTQPAPEAQPQKKGDDPVLKRALEVLVKGKTDTTARSGDATNPAKRETAPDTPLQIPAPKQQ